MIFLLSPAKKLLCDGIADGFPITAPSHLDEAEYLIGKLRKKSARQLGKMMHISADLAGLNHERYQKWTRDIDDHNSRQAALMFNGEVYAGLNASSWKKRDVAYAQEHLRILSGLYGLLRPMDSISPYRLEMGSSFAVTPAKKNLYTYWGDSISENLSAELEQQNSSVIVNLASQEYSKAARLPKTGARVITASFKDLHKGEYKALMVYAKKARGLMADFAVRNRVSEPESLKSFDSQGYYFNEKLSVDDDWVFTRDQRNQ